MAALSKCPDAEAIGALIDNRLEKRARRRILTHLEQCASCGEDFVEIARTLEEIDEPRREQPETTWLPWKRREKTGGRTLGFFRRRTFAIYGALAAASLTLIFLGPLANLFAADWAAMAWWRNRYAPVSGPMVARAQAVFTRVSAAAGLERAPELAVLDIEDSPFALAAREGVVLSRNALALCYRGVPETEGDRRLAFTLSHELAHLQRGERLHAFAAYTVHRRGDRGLADKLKDRVQAGDLADRELAADQLGLLYATMAGYEPARLLDRDGSFFEAWAAQPTAEAAYDTHPDPKTRAERLIEQLDTLAANLDDFEFGVRLYDLGRFSQAQALFERFHRHFPAREASANLGLCHFQQAARLLSECDSERALRFKWPTVIDRDTLLRRSPSRGADEDACLEEEAFQERMARALANFDAALQRDPGHFPSLLNRMTAQLFAGDAAEAMIAAEDLMDEGVRDRRLAHVHALASFLNARANQLSETADVAKLRELSAQWSEDAALAYNLAAALRETGRHEEADQAARAFLELEPAGPHAAYVRTLIGLPPREPAAGAEPPPSPIPLGEMDDATRAALGAARPPGTDAAPGPAIYHGPAFSALAWDGAVVMVRVSVHEHAAFRNIASPRDRWTASTATAAYGPALRRVDADGRDIRYYRDFALEILDSRVTHILYFEAE